VRGSAVASSYLILFTLNALLDAKDKQKGRTYENNQELKKVTSEVIIRKNTKLW
jgi:hypothetical protein